MRKRKQKHGINFLGWFMSVLVFVLGGLIFSVEAYPAVFKTQVVLARESGVGSTEDVVLDFSQAMLPSWRKMQIKVLPEQQVMMTWSQDKRKLQIAPLDFWLPDTKYEILLENGKSLKMTSLNAKLEFTTQKYPAVKSFYPALGQEDVVVDIEDPIAAEFDQSLKDFNVKFMFNPAVEMNYETDEELRKVRLMPKDKLIEGQKYEVEIFVKHKKESGTKYRKIAESYFSTKKLLLEPAAWDKDPVLRLEQARGNTLARILTGKYIDVNLAQQILVRFENGRALDATYISSGKPGMDTPIGNFQIHNKSPRVWSKKYSLFMPYWMALVGSGEFGFHELPEWPGGYKEGANHLGRPVSHGCVRLGVGPAKTLYDWAEIGTPVVIHK